MNEYLAWLREVLVPNRVERATAELAGAYARSGVQGFWQAELKLCLEETRSPRTLMRAPFDRYCGPYFMARRYARLGDRHRALALLGTAFAQRHHLMVFLWVEPLFDSLRTDRRFQDLGSRMGRSQPR